MPCVDIAARTSSQMVLQKLYCSKPLSGRRLVAPWKGSRREGDDFACHLTNALVDEHVPKLRRAERWASLYMVSL